MSFYLTLALILFFYMTAWFVVSLIKERNDVADVAWGLGFVVLSWSGFFLAEAASGRALIVVILVSIWGIRLASHIAARHRGKPEDFRYAQWRNEWGKWFFLRSYAQVYLLQGALLFLVALPVLVICAATGRPWGMLDVMGMLIWGVGFFFESVGDSQLATFLKNPDNVGRLMQSGLWRYTRHPNYFGEVTQWWGIWIIALAVPYGILAIIGPLMITFLILKVSGVPLLEKKMAEHPDFLAYRNHTSMFFPLPPKEN